MVSDAAREMLRAHVIGELAGDLDATMAPLSDHPIWLIPNYRLEGREAVRAMYERALKVMPAAYTEEILRAHRGLVQVVHFDGDRIAGEHGYQTLHDQTARSGGDFGRDFEELPGVTRLF